MAGISINWMAKIAFVFGVLLLPNKSLWAQAKPSEKPNLLIIINDQWRGQAMGYQGKELVKTPYLDAFAKTSFVSTQMITNYPLCSPSRAMLFSGTYPLKNKVYSNVNSKSTPYGIELSADQVCISDVLKANGYFNGYIGKWHLDSPHEPYVKTSNNKETAWNEWTPPNRRHNYEYWYAYGTYDEHDKPLYWDTNASRDSFHYVNEWGPKHEADKAIAFFENKNNIRPANKPFSLVVSINPPHSGYKSVPKKYYDLYKDVALESLLTDPDIPAPDTKMGKLYRDNIKYYYANITGADEQIGRILEGLKQSGLQKNTLIVFMADHGNSLGKHDEVSKNHFYEESLRIPFIMHWDGKILSRTDNQMLMSVPDIFPTLMGLMGVKESLPTDLDGRNFASYIASGEGDFAKQQFLLGSITASDPTTGFRGIRTINYKLVYSYKKKQVERYLFDIEKDPFELNNIYNANPNIVKLLKKDLKNWLVKTDDKFNLDR